MLVGRDDFQHVAAYAEGTPMKIIVIARILHIHQTGNDILHGEPLSFLDRDNQFGIIFGRSETVDAGYRGHDNNVPPGQQRVRGGVAQLVDIVVDG